MKRSIRLQKLLFFNISIFCLSKFLKVLITKKIFGETDLSTTLAAQVENYLLGEDLDEIIEKVTAEVKEKILQVKNNIPKWADDAMTKDKDFCEFIIQTIRMDAVFQDQASDSKWLFENPRGKRISKILMKYGSNVSESSDPKKYDKLIQKWMTWSELIEQKKKSGEIPKVFKLRED